MFLDKLLIYKDGDLVREIAFHKGLNLIIDETHTKTLQESGNNVGKTTVLRLVDFCLGGDGKNIYRDPEFKDKNNTQIEQFLTKNDIRIVLTLKQSLESRQAPDITIQRNFLKYSKKIQTINGESYSDNNEFTLHLKKLIFKSSDARPTFRQIVSKNIRDEKNKLSNTIKVLSYASAEEYEALFFFWLGIPLESAKRKEELLEQRKTEEGIVARLKGGSSESEILQALSILDRDIRELNLQKSEFNLNVSYEEDIKTLNNVKLKLNQISTQISVISTRRSLIKESQRDLENESANIDAALLRDMYDRAKLFVPAMQKKFSDLVAFHNEMIKSKIQYIAGELPKLDESLQRLEREMNTERSIELDLSHKLKKSGFIEDLEAIIRKLNAKHESKGKYEEQLAQWKKSNKTLKSINEELEKINAEVVAKAQLLDARILEFNKFFSKLSDQLYGEQFVLSPARDRESYTLKISNVSGNLGTGKKKGQMAAFDFAHVQFCDANSIPCLHFILHDQMENMHDNQIKVLAEVSSNVNSQFVVPILRDKFPLEVDPYTVVSLSQNDKLFKV